MFSPLVKRKLFAGVTLLALLATAAASNSATEGAYAATLYRSSGGIPHIIANDWGSIGYGTGYAAAEDHLCKQSRNAIKFRGELAANFGPGDGNLDSDLFFKLLEKEGIFEETIDVEFERLFAGYAAGFNRYLRDKGIDNVSDPACSGADWVQPLSTDDVKRFHLTPAFLPSFAQLCAAVISRQTSGRQTRGHYQATRHYGSSLGRTDEDVR